MTEVERLARIRFIVLDVDGTLTDGGIWYGTDGTEYKRFHVRDGAGILLAEAAGIEFVILTARTSECVRRRAQELHITRQIQGVQAKRQALTDMMARENIPPEDVAYMGDDLVDLPPMAVCGYRACPADAADEVKARCEYVAPEMGGQGAVRSFIEYVLKGRGQWEQLAHTYYGSIEPASASSTASN